MFMMLWHIVRILVGTYEYITMGVEG